MFEMENTYFQILKINQLCYSVLLKFIPAHSNKFKHSHKATWNLSLPHYKWPNCNFVMYKLYSCILWLIHRNYMTYYWKYQPISKYMNFYIFTYTTLDEVIVIAFTCTCICNRIRISFNGISKHTIQSLAANSRVKFCARRLDDLWLSILRFNEEKLLLNRIYNVCVYIKQSEMKQDVCSVMKLQTPKDRKKIFKNYKSS